MADIIGTIGLGTIALLALDVVLLILIIVLFVQLRRQKVRQEDLEERISRFMRGSDGKSLEETMDQMFDEHDDLMKTQKDNRRDIDNIYNRIRTMIQKVGVVKYDAFDQMGGSLSSSIALLDQDDNGFIINTVQSVEGCYSYVKEIHHGRPDVALGKEEAAALQKAQNFGVMADTDAGRKGSSADEK